MKTERLPILSIAGYDPSGGAGVLADCKVFELHKLNGMAVCTALTFQNEKRFESLTWVGVDRIIAQISVLMEVNQFDYIKIGLIENIQVLKEVLDFILSKNKYTKIIWDPILKSSTGYQFHDRLNEGLLEYCLGKIYLITPNRDELNKLFTSEHSFQNKLRRSAGFCNVLLTGGHNEANNADDLLVEKEAEYILKGEKLSNVEKHGSGCVLSSSILSNLVLGFNLKESCVRGKAYTKKFLQSSNQLIGYHFD